MKVNCMIYIDENKNFEKGLLETSQTKPTTIYKMGRCLCVGCWGRVCGMEAPIDPQGILATRALTAYTPHTAICKHLVEQPDWFISYG